MRHFKKCGNTLLTPPWRTGISSHQLIYHVPSAFLIGRCQIARVSFTGHIFHPYNHAEVYTCLRRRCERKGTCQKALEKFICCTQDVSCSKKELKIFFIRSTIHFFPHNFIGNNNLFNCKLFLYGLSFYFLLNNSENEQ